jgi:hypothetical protein
MRSLMPDPNPWPATDQKSLTAFYGHPGDDERLVKLNVEGLGVKYDGNPTKWITCHERVEASLFRVLTAISKGPHAAILGRFDGCYNNRPMRGGSLPSVHARAAAVDFDGALNGNLIHWPATAIMPLTVMEEFAKEGWVGLGWLIGRDAMHFQATR